MSNTLRLQRYLAQAGLCSRRAAEELIRAGRVEVNGQTVSELGTKVDPSQDVISVDGERLRTQQKKVYLFHKPRNVVSTLSDPEGRPCVGDYVSSLPVRVFPVGRLDYDVNGLLVLTNDGDYSDLLLHPRNGAKRVYVARIRGQLTDAKIDRLQRGMRLEDGSARFEDVTILPATSNWLKLVGTSRENSQAVQLTVSEGRKHLVKRLLLAIGNPVVRLARIKFAQYSIDDLKPGHIREATKLGTTNVATRTSKKESAQPSRKSLRGPKLASTAKKRGPSTPSRAPSRRSPNATKNRPRKGRS